MHNLVTSVTELSAKLATRSRHVCVLLGAGASMSAGLPDLAGLTAKVKSSLAATPVRAKQFADLTAVLTLEEVLTRLRRIATLLRPGADTIDGLTKDQAVELDAAVCQAIIAAIRTPGSLDAFNRFGSWAGRAAYTRPLEIFTTNYDLLIEGGLEHSGVTYFDGFAGNLEGYFRPDLVEQHGSSDSTLVPASFARVWKLHGSSNWEAKSGSRIVRRGSHVDTNSVVAIYPSDEKYSDSRRVPFVVLMDRFRRALHEPESLLIINGYSFGDQHLNEIILEAARRRPRSEFVATCRRKIPDALRAAAVATRNVSVFSAEEGIFGGNASGWDPAPDIVNVSDNKKCKLGDFASLSAFLDSQGVGSVGL